MNYCSLSLVTLLIASNCVLAEGQKQKRVINESTSASRIFSTTPTYRSLYKMEVLDVDVSCDANSLDASKVTELPKSALFRKTFDENAQTENEMVVHVYDVPSEQGKENETKDKYFSKPFKICTAGKNYTSKSKYNRVGGMNTGVLFVPFKMRSGDLFADTEVGPYVSYKFEKLEYLLNVGISQISISEVGTKDVESKTGLTVALGVNFEVAKNWDIAILSGVDHLSGAEGDTWEYQDKPWLSFSIGFNFTR